MEEDFEMIRPLFLKMKTMAYRRTFCLLVRQIEQTFPEMTTCLTVSIDLLKETELQDYVGFHSYPEPSTILSRLRTGHRCFVARCKGRIVNAAWAVPNEEIGFSYFDAIHRRVAERLAPDEVYVYDVFTLPPFRGKNIVGVVFARMIRYFQDVGYKRMIVIVEPKNKASLRLMEKAGYRPVRMLHFLALGPFVMMFGWGKQD